MRTTFLLIACIVLQFTVLTGMLLVAALPHWLGEPIRLQTLPVDPRSLFRGNYVQLRYEISSLSRDLFDDPDRLRQDEVVYVELEQDENQLWQFAGVTLEEPAQPTRFIRGRLRHRTGDKDYEVRFGIEALFAPEDVALALEESQMQGGVASVMLTDRGQAALVGLEEFAEPDQR